MLVDLFLVYQFVKKLSTPFKEWDAFKLGIIDENGTILKKRKSFTTMAEKAAFGYFDLVILNLKKILSTLPGGTTKIASYAAALYLLKEYKLFSAESYLTESSSEEMIKNFSKWYFDYTNNGAIVNKINEEVVTNSIAAGGVAGFADAFVDDDGDRDRFDDVNPKLSAAYRIYNHEKELKRLYQNSLKMNMKVQNQDEKDREKMHRDHFKLFTKEDVTNSAGSGAIAGLGVGPEGEPGVSTAKQKALLKIRRRLAEKR